MPRDKTFHRNTRIHREQRSMRITSRWGIFGRYTIGTLTRQTLRLTKRRPGTCNYGCCRHEIWLTDRPTGALMVRRNRARKPLLHRGRKP
jgi:hypothetical protein